MSSPRRLWTGDWQRDSALHAEELAARRRGLVEQPPPEEPAADPETPAPKARRRSVAALLPRALAALAALRRRIKARIVLPIAIALLLVVALAFAIGSLFGGSDNSNLTASSASVIAAERWLGVQFASVPRGGVSIETVSPNGVAADAGLEPGDVLSQIDSRSIYRIGDAAGAIDRLNAGDQAVITVNRGSAIYSTSFPMPPRPAGP